MLRGPLSQRSSPGLPKQMRWVQRTLEAPLQHPVNDPYATHVPADRSSRLELLRRARWLDQFDDPVPAPGSHESVQPSHILQALHIAECDRGNSEWFHFRYRDTSGACLLRFSMCGPALDLLPAFCRDNRSAARESGHDPALAWREFRAERRCPCI